LRITAKAKTKEQALHLIESLEQRIRERASEFIYGVDDETLEGVVGRMLKERSLTISVAESCTGGLVTDTLTNIPG